jgi:hypothetical protein
MFGRRIGITCFHRQNGKIKLWLFESSHSEMFIWTHSSKNKIMNLKQNTTWCNGLVSYEIFFKANEKTLREIKCLLLYGILVMKGYHFPITESYISGHINSISRFFLRSWLFCNLKSMPFNTVNGKIEQCPKDNDNFNNPTNIQCKKYCPR